MGKWSGTFLVSECVKTGGIFQTTCADSQMPGKTFPVAIVFTEAMGSSLRGYAAYSSRAETLLESDTPDPIFQQFSVTLEADQSLHFDSVAVSRFGTDELTWTLKVVKASRLDGTLQAKTIVSREPGNTVVTGTVTLNRVN